MKIRPSIAGGARRLMPAWWGSALMAIMRIRVARPSSSDGADLPGTVSRGSASRGAIVSIFVVIAAMMMFAYPLAADAAAASATSMPAAAGVGPNAVVATVGSHRITRHEMDAEVLDEVIKRIPADQLYDLRKDAVDKLVDQYLIDQAAKKAH
ncbi:MAG: hypothetical protein ACREQN_11865, partial [Candidatus Binataceae bacterium]